MTDELKLLVSIVIVALSFINERGFENLISKPFFDKYIKPLKPFQSYLVMITGYLLAYGAKQLGVELVPDLAPYFSAPGDVVTVFAGLAIAVLSMAIHNVIKVKPAAGGPVG